MSNIIIYNASAGSGKTYQIALKYLELLSKFGKEAARNILAITFTNKAAFEMKERILSFLKEIAKQTEKGKDLEEKTNLTPEQATHLLEYLLLNYDFFQVKTIDSFLLVLYRALAYELGINATFHIKKYLDETLIEKALIELYEDTNKNPHLKDFLEYFLNHIISTSEKLKLNFRNIFIRSLTTLTEKITHHKVLIENLEVKQKELEHLSLKDFSQTDLDQTSLYLYFYGLLKRYLEKVLEKEKTLFLGYWKEKLIQSLTQEDFIPWIYVKLGSLKALIVDEFQDTDRLQWEALSPITSDLLSREGYLVCAGDPKQSIFRWKEGDPFLFEEILTTFSSTFVKQETLNKNYRSCKNIVSFNNVFFSSFKNSLDLKKEILKFLIFSKKDREKIDTDSILSAVLNQVLTEVEKIFSNVRQQAEKSLNGKVMIIRFSVENLEKDLNSLIREEIKHKILEILKVLEKEKELEDVSILCRKNEEVAEISSFLIDNGYKVVASSSLHLKESPAVNTFVSLLKFILNEKDEISLAGFLSGPFCEKGKEILRDYLENIVVLGYKENLVDFIKERKKEFWHSFFAPLFQFKESYSLYELCLKIVQFLKLEEKVPSEIPYLYKFLTVVFEFQKKGGDFKEFLVYWDKYSEDEIDIPEEKDSIKVLTIHQAKGLEFRTVIFPLTWKEPGFSSDLNLVFYNGKVFRGKKEELPEEGKIGWYMEKAKERLEILNLLYVGFTRAIKNLYILVPEIDKDEIIVAKVFSKIYSSLEERLEFEPEF